MLLLQQEGPSVVVVAVADKTYRWIGCRMLRDLLETLHSYWNDGLVRLPGVGRGRIDIPRTATMSRFAGRQRKNGTVILRP